MQVADVLAPYPGFDRTVLTFGKKSSSVLPEEWDGHKGSKCIAIRTAPNIGAPESETEQSYTPNQLMSPNPKPKAKALNLKP